MNKMQFAKFLSKLLLCHLHFLHWKIARLQPKVERNSNYFCWGNYALKLHSITREAISSGFLNFPQILLRILVNKLVQDTLHHISRGCRMSSPKWLMIFTSFHNVKKSSKKRIYSETSFARIRTCTTSLARRKCRSSLPLSHCTTLLQKA